MFAKIALLSAFASLVAGAALDVWTPPITSPTSASVWAVGSVQNVTWDTSGQPTRVTNPIANLILSKEGFIGLAPHTLATGFPLSQGFQVITVPDVEPGTDYVLVLFGDSGDMSPEFEITA